MIWVILFFVSFSFNLFMGWYVKNLLKDLSFVSSKMSEFKENLNTFIQNIENFLSIEIFSDEPAVRALRNTAFDFKEEVSQFDEIIALTEEVEYGEETQG